MMKMKRYIHIILFAVGALLAAACGRTEVHINVSDSQLAGLWQKNSTEEFWRYETEGHTGVTWDASEDITEEESNLTFTWSVNGDVLRHVFTGAQNNQAVPKVYTVKEISSTAMTWEDDYGLTHKFTKVE